MSRAPSFVNDENSLGIFPVSLLQLRFTAISSDGILPRLPGISPERLLLLRSNNCNFTHEPNWLGIEPEIWFFLRMSFVSR